MKESTASTFGLRKLFFYITDNVHPYSLIIVIVLDLIWNIPELALGSCLEIPLMATIFFICFSVVNSIQLTIAGDEKNEAQIKGIVFGIIAAAPFSVVSLIVGGVFGLLKIIFGYDKYAMLVGKLVMEWADLENDVNNLLPSTYNQKNDTLKQIKKKFQFLVDKNKITKSFFDAEIDPIREIRNKVTHPFNKGGLPTEQELEVALNNIPSVRQRLKQ